MRLSRRWIALLALPVVGITLSCWLALVLMRAGTLVPPAGKRDLGAFSVVAGDELRLCPDNRTVCGRYYRIDVMIPRERGPDTTHTVLRLEREDS